MEFKSIEDRFSIPFPGKPTVQTITWPSEYGAVFPGRVYTVQQGASRYSVTVIDYTDAVAIHAKIAKPESFQQDIYAQIDVQASIQYAASKLYRIKPGAKVTYDAWHYINLIEGHQLQLTNADGTKTYVVDLPAREPALHRRRDGAGQLARAGHLPAEPGYARREGRRRALQRDLLEPAPAPSPEGTRRTRRRRRWWRPRRCAPARPAEVQRTRVANSARGLVFYVRPAARYRRRASRSAGSRPVNPSNRSRGRAE